jgi:hypothetical protein
MQVKICTAGGLLSSAQLHRVSELSHCGFRAFWFSGSAGNHLHNAKLEALAVTGGLLNE